jgi:hypothetical protein
MLLVACVARCWLLLLLLGAACGFAQTKDRQQAWHGLASVWLCRPGGGWLLSQTNNITSRNVPPPKKNKGRTHKQGLMFSFFFFTGGFGETKFFSGLLFAFVLTVVVCRHTNK